jgi:serine/threonine protein kinase
LYAPASSETAVSNGAERYGRYEIVERIAAGGMGEVYLARSLGAAGFQRFVVIKKILPHLVEQMQFVDGLIREAKLLVMLDHPNIVQVLDLGVEGKDYFMAMEFVHGYNMAAIAHYCAQKRVLIPANACAFIVLQTLAGLDYAHTLKGPEGERRNIIHRDVSPQNVMISRDGRVKLTDFGIAKVLNEAEGEFTQSLKGKFRYMAPEAVDGGRVDQRYDIFASGILLFEGLCRRHLFGGRNDVDILNQVREARVPPLERYHPNIPHKIVDVTRRALIKDPDQRYQTAAEFANDLREAIKPATEAAAGEELKRFIADLYERPDFPINKPKLPDLQAVDVDNTRSIVLRSHISEHGGGGLTEHQARAIRTGSRSPALMLIAVAIAVLAGLVGFLVWKVLFPPKTAPGKKTTAPVIHIGYEKVDARASQPDQRPPVDIAVPDAKLTPTKKNGRPIARPPRCIPKPFDGKRATRVVGRRHRRLNACLNRYEKDAAQLRGIYFNVLSTGRVYSVQVVPKALQKTALGRCVRRAVSGVRFRCHDKPAISFQLPLRVTSK